MAPKFSAEIRHPDLAAFDKARNLWELCTGWQRTDDPRFRNKPKYPKLGEFKAAIRERAEVEGLALNTADDWLNIAGVLAEEVAARYAWIDKMRSGVLIKPPKRDKRVEGGGFSSSLLSVSLEWQSAAAGRSVRFRRWIKWVRFPPQTKFCTGALSVLSDTE